MKKGHSKNRHFSKGINKCKRPTYCRECKRRSVKSANVQLAEKNLKWSRISTAIQFADFLTDKLPQLFKWLVYFLWMG